MLAGLAFCEYPQSAFQGFCRGHQKRSAAVCDPNPPRPFARYRKAQLGVPFLGSPKFRKVSEQKFPELFKFWPPILHLKMLPKFSPNVREVISCFDNASWETETTEISHKKTLPFFNADQSFSVPAKQ